MDINNTDLLLIDPIEMTIIHKQTIPSIRVWGVGREDSRDFAYVAKDKEISIRIYKCHVFRCDSGSARIIANTLRDICRNLMIERGLLTKTTEITDGSHLSMPNDDILPSLIAFPTPMNEPKNDLTCTYLGCIYVEKPSGIDVLRAAIQRVSTTVPEDKWFSVTVHMSPSSISITTNNVQQSDFIFF